MPAVFSVIAQLEDCARSIAHLHGTRLIAVPWLLFFMVSWIFGEDAEF
jgi:hypothetical protein